MVNTASKMLRTSAGSPRTVAAGVATLLVALAIALAAISAGAPQVSAQQETADVTISILHNNDGESKLLPSDEFPGISRFVGALQDLQAGSTADGVITLTSGDNFLASKEFNASLERGAPYYDSVALSGLYDAMALGNHDFDFGPDVTAAFVSGFDPAIPFLSANADFSGEPALAALEAEGRIAGSTIIDVAGTRVGVIGAVTPLLPSISSPRNVVISDDVAGAVNSEVSALEAAGVNKIILISHLQGVTADRELIPLLTGVDVVIAGGGDELFANDGDTCAVGDVVAPYPSLVQDADGNDVPLVTGPGGYRCIGQLDVGFTAAGAVVSATGSANAVPTDQIPDPSVRGSVEVPLASALAVVEANIIGMSEVPLDGQRASVRTTSSNEGSLLADALLDAGNRLGPAFGAGVPAVAIQNGGGIRNDSVIASGAISEGTTFDIAPFPNFVVITEVTRDRFKELLEVAMGGLPGQSGRFAQPAGFTVAVDITKPARELDSSCAVSGSEGMRITDVTLDDGTAIVVNGAVIDGPPVRLATIDFLVRGGDCYPLGDLDFTRLGITYQQALAEYISDTLGGEITAADYPAAGTNRVQITDGYGSGQLPTPTPTPVAMPTTAATPTAAAATPTAEPAATPTAIAPMPTVVVTPTSEATPTGQATPGVTAVPTTIVAPAATAMPTSTPPPITPMFVAPTTVADGSGFGFGSTVPKKATSVSPHAKKAATPVAKAVTPLAVTGGEARPVVAYGLLMLIAGFGLATLGRRLRFGD